MMCVPLIRSRLVCCRRGRRGRRADVALISIVITRLSHHPRLHHRAFLLLCEGLTRLVTQALRHCGGIHTDSFTCVFAVDQSSESEALSTPFGSSPERTFPLDQRTVLVPLLIHLRRLKD